MFDLIIDMAKSSWNPKVPKRGSVLRVQYSRIMGAANYDHFGIYAGNQQVIHFSEGQIRKESMEKFMEDATLTYLTKCDVMTFKSDYLSKYSLEDSYARAVSQIGKTGYDVFNNNCEHFALWCRTGEAYSGQALGSHSDFFSHQEQLARAASINVPRLMGVVFNKMGMRKDFAWFFNEDK